MSIITVQDEYKPAQAFPIPPADPSSLGVIVYVQEKPDHLFRGNPAYKTEDTHAPAIVYWYGVMDDKGNEYFASGKPMRLSGNPKSALMQHINAIRGKQAVGAKIDVQDDVGRKVQFACAHEQGEKTTFVRITNVVPVNKKFAAMIPEASAFKTFVKPESSAAPSTPDTENDQDADDDLPF